MNDQFQWRVVNGREYLECRPLADVARHLFSTRQLELPAEPGARRAGLQWFAKDLGVDGDRLLRARQVHGATVRVGGRPEDLPDADAIVSGDSGIACVVQVADCGPILIAGRLALSNGDPPVVVAAVHAGWRGTAAGVAARAVEALIQQGVARETLVAAIGPSIGPCCYQVDAPVRDGFARSEYGALLEEAFEADGDDHWRLDVARANGRILERAGVPAQHVHLSGLCTACDRTRFYSYRAEGQGTGRLVAGITAGR